MENKSPYIISGAIELLRLELDKTGNYAWTNVTNLIESKMEYDEKGHLLDTEYNYEVADRIISELNKATETMTLYNRVEETASSVWYILNETLAYYSENFGQIPPDTIRVAEGIAKTAESLILSMLTRTEINDNIIDPARIAIDGLIRQGATAKESLNVMYNKIQERFAHFIAPAAQTQLEQYLRELTALFAKDFQLVWIKYVREPSEADRRDFCANYDFEFTNTYYHVEEVKLWASEHSYNWKGMIPGTNAANILTNAGGYNCKHSFLFVNSWEVPEKDKSRAKQKGLI